MALVGDFLWAWLSPYMLSRKSIVSDSMGFPFNVQCKRYPCASAPFAEQGRAEKQNRRLTRSEGAKKKPLRAWIKFSLACWR